MFYVYSADRNAKNLNVTRLNPSDYISEHTLIGDSVIDYNGAGVLIEGLYNL